MTLLIIILVVLLSHRCNVDQSPLTFAINTKTTYELLESKNSENRHKKVWVSRPGPGLDKRKCSSQVCFLSPGLQSRICAIVNETGKIISAAEKSSWHPVHGLIPSFALWVEGTL